VPWPFDEGATDLLRQQAGKPAAFMMNTLFKGWHPLGDFQGGNFVLWHNPQQWDLLKEMQYSVGISALQFMLPGRCKSAR
jgi:hypothetical protein